MYCTKVKICLFLAFASGVCPAYGRCDDGSDGGGGGVQGEWVSGVCGFVVGCGRFGEIGKFSRCALGSVQSSSVASVVHQPCTWYLGIETCAAVDRL